MGTIIIFLGTLDFFAVNIFVLALKSAFYRILSTLQYNRIKKGEGYLSISLLYCFFRRAKSDDVIFDIRHHQK